MKGYTPVSQGSGVFFTQPAPPFGVVFVLDIELCSEYNTTNGLAPPTGRRQQHNEEE